MTPSKAKPMPPPPGAPNGALVMKLKQAGNEWQSITELAAALHSRRPALAAALDRLEAFGYQLDYHPRMGVRLRTAADLLTNEEIAHDLETRVVGRRIAVFSSATSTNDVAAAAAREGAVDGHVVFAERQTRGRGRRGRTWASARAKGLWFSVILRPQLPEDGASLLTLAAAVAVAEAVRTELHVHALIRWPNDIVVRSRKLGGLLVEALSDGQRGRVYIVGIGINANYGAAEMPRHIRKLATSLMIEKRGPVDRIRLARAVLRRLDDWYARLSQGKGKAISVAWRRLSATLGRSVAIEQHGRRFRGKVVDIDATGSLVLRFRSGFQRRFRAHEVTRLEQNESWQ